MQYADALIACIAERFRSEPQISEWKGRASARRRGAAPGGSEGRDTDSGYMTRTIESVERINSIREAKQLKNQPSIIYESKLPYVSLSNLPVLNFHFSAHVPGDTMPAHKVTPRREDNLPALCKQQSLQRAGKIAMSDYFFS